MPRRVVGSPDALARRASALGKAAVRVTGDHRAAEEAYRAAAAAHSHHPALRAHYESQAAMHRARREGKAVPFHTERAGRQAEPIADLAPPHVKQAIANRTASVRDESVGKLRKRIESLQKQIDKLPPPAKKAAAPKAAPQQALKKGPRGGSYYTTPTGKKVYV